MGFLKKKIIFTITVIVESDNDKFHAYCPALKGLHVDGNTKEEASENAIYASIIYLKSLIKHGDPIPLGVEVFEETRQQVLPIMTPPSKFIRQVPITI